MSVVRKGREKKRQRSHHGQPSVGLGKVLGELGDLGVQRSDARTIVSFEGEKSLMPDADPGPAFDVLREVVVDSLDEVFDRFSRQKTREGGDDAKEPGIESSKPGGKRVGNRAAGVAHLSSRPDVLGPAEHLEVEHDGHQQHDYHIELGDQLGAIREDASQPGTNLCEGGDANDQRAGQRREVQAHGEEGEKCGSDLETGQRGKREGIHCEKLREDRTGGGGKRVGAV